MNNEYLKTLHCEIISIMDAIDAFCNKHNLRYYLIGGTLLGAVRHGGFIPWDDDLDIAMPREDFDRFVKLAASQMGEAFKLEWITTNPRYFLRFAKISKRGTSFVEHQGEGFDSDFGIFVDIFPLDVTDGYSAGVEWRRTVCKKLEILMHLRNERRYGAKHLLAKLIPNRVMHKLATKVMSVKHRGNGGYYSNFGSQYRIQKQTMPISWYGDGTPVDFAGRTYCAPCEYTKVLQSIFGDKYMSLPPEEKRRTHYPQRVVFSDQTAMHFDGNHSSLSVEDSLNF